MASIMAAPRDTSIIPRSAKCSPPRRSDHCSNYTGAREECREGLSAKYGNTLLRPPAAAAQMSSRCFHLPGPVVSHQCKIPPRRSTCEIARSSHTSRAMTNQTTNNTVLTLELPGIKKLKSGKVREIFDLGDAFLFVASDRISAFDCVMPNGIPRKGEVLTQLSHFWFDQVANIVPNHRLAGPNDPLPANLKPFEAQIARRSMIVKKAQPLAVECIVRGYLAGSGWKEYKKSQTVCGSPLPAGLQESSELPEPIFTPSTKAETGHDENISFDEAKKILGDEIANQASDLSLKIYKFARDYARQR